MSYEEHRQSLTIPYYEPSQAKTLTTHDAISASHTIPAVPNKPGDTQVHGGIEYVYDGSQWIPIHE